MSLIGIIGGSGLTDLKDLQITRRAVVRTPYGEPSAPMVFGRLSEREVVFLPRHGPGHTIPPHEINYRANLWALKETETSTVIAVNAVGAIKSKLADASLVFPDQIIDYTYGREHTFFGSDQRQVTHVDFSEPYCEKLRVILIEAARRAAIPAAETGTYGATQGPRFESAAEIRRLERDGADIVGMTGMPEAGLARELGLCYACIAVVANPAAGKAEGGISLKAVEKNLQVGMIKVRKLLEEAIPMIASE
jgi:5'-methylthioadenosine phosphorylase/5'-methylthioinosine phosphorylase